MSSRARDSQYLFNKSDSQKTDDTANGSTVLEELWGKLRTDIDKLRTKRISATTPLLISSLVKKAPDPLQAIEAEIQLIDKICKDRDLRISLRKCLMGPGRIPSLHEIESSSLVHTLNASKIHLNELADTLNVSANQTQTP